MNGRRFAAAFALALTTAVTIPALATAAPVQPSRALLTAAEFPSGTTNYTAERTTPSAGIGGPESADCAHRRDALEAEFKAAGSATAAALRGRSTIRAAVIDRPVASRATEFAMRCPAPGTPAPIALGVPSDLQHARPSILSSGADFLSSWADVRGTTVLVLAIGEDGAPADRDAFWQTLRAQIAKVERQP